ncbi:hypothetical protein [Alteromonas gilva]|uniref:MarR family transcriptional regulator n=1 Tax=Alteromonas gilva TaxID=2987522 RepID=A0ABT5L7C2_9ALTE|nr:hypothetical protein [Alteromonas gilva]MDC8832936.1 hypothetical protein [Alteromonas gilva]
MQTITPHHKRVQIAYYALENGQLTHKYLAKKFGTTEKEVSLAVDRLSKGSLLSKKGKTWNPIWGTEDFVFHPTDNYINRDIEKGEKDSVLTYGVFDPDYDPVNGGYHLRWTEDEVNQLLCDLPYRVLELIRDSDPGSEIYQECILFLESPLFLAICKKWGMDQEEILKSVLEITKAEI